MRIDDIDARTDQVDSEHVFGFNKGADIGGKGECRRGSSGYGVEQPRTKLDLPSEGDRDMHEVDLSNVLIGAGCFSVLTGMLQLFCQALEVRPAKRGRISTGLNFGKWSLRSTAPGFIMIAIGVLLLGSLSVQ
jgi:hypothetical protein